MTPNPISINSFNAVLENISRRVWGLLKKDKSVIGVDIGSSAIKVVQLREKRGKAVLETYGELALGPYANLAIGQAAGLTTERIGEALKDVMREASVTSKNAGIGIPLASSLITVIEMPFLSERQLKDMVPIEARKYIPVPISEVNLDWRVLPEMEKAPSYEEAEKEEGDEERGAHAEAQKPAERLKKARVLIAAIHNETLTKYQQIALKAELRIGFFEIEVFSSLRALLRREPGTVFVLDIGAGTSKMLTIEEGIIVSSHTINRGSQDITATIARGLGVTMTKAEEMKREIGLSQDPVHKNQRDLTTLVVQSIFSDASRVLLDYEKKFHKPVNKVILSGGGSLLLGIQEFAEKNLEVEIILADQFSKVETPAFLEETLKKAGPNFTVALGTALRMLEEVE